MIKKILNFICTFIVGLICWIFMIGVLFTSIGVCIYIVSALSMFSVMVLIFKFIFWLIMIVILIAFISEIFDIGNKAINKIKRKFNNKLNK